LHDEQHSFRQKRSCEIQLLLTIHDLARNFDVMFLDFSKTFDNNLLLYKLEHYGVRGQLLMWLTDLLSGRKQQVIIEGCQSCHSNPTEVTLAVPHGSVLGPLLFLCFINDTPTDVKCKIRL